MAERFDPQQRPLQEAALCYWPDGAVLLEGGAVLVLLEGGALPGLLEGVDSIQLLEGRRFVARLWALLVPPPLWAPPKLLGQRQMILSFDDLGRWQACFPEQNINE